MRTFECEVCGKTETLTDAEAFNQGWDYPPWMGVAGIISPRTCGDCPMTATAWWAMTTNQPLTDHQKEWVLKITNGGI